MALLCAVTRSVVDAWVLEGKLSAAMNLLASKAAEHNLPLGSVREPVQPLTMGQFSVIWACQVARRSLRRTVEASLAAGLGELVAAGDALTEWRRVRDSLTAALQHEHGLEEDRIALSLEAWMEKVVRREGLSVAAAVERLKDELSHEREMEKETQSVWDTVGNATLGKHGDPGGAGDIRKAIESLPAAELADGAFQIQVQLVWGQM